MIASGAPTWIGLITGVLSFIGMVFVAVYTSRSSRAASRETAEMTTQAKGWDDLTKSHSAEIARLREDRVEDEKRHREALDACNGRIDDLARRVAAAEEREAAAQAQLRAVVEWARQVVQLMRAAKFEFPPPPPGVDDYNTGGSTRR